MMMLYQDIVNVFILLITFSRTKLNFLPTKLHFPQQLIHIFSQIYLLAIIKAFLLQMLNNFSE